jgi:single-strand DNA-binding protein
MSLTINNVVLAGNLGQDPQVRFLANEKAVCSFSLAVNRRWKDKDGQQQEKTTWVPIEAWGRTAELCGQYLQKGSTAVVIGHLEEDSWDDKETGKKRTKLKLVADQVQFASPKSEKKEPQAGEAEPAPSRPARPAPAAGGDDEPPF